MITAPILLIIILYPIIMFVVSICLTIILTDENNDLKFIKDFPTPKVLRHKHNCSILGVIFFTILLIIFAPIPYFIKLLFRGDK